MSTPVVRDMAVIPVAGHDSMLLNFSGAHEVYQREGLGGRDDAIAMQYLIPDWTFDSKRPALHRS